MRRLRSCQCGVAVYHHPPRPFETDISNVNRAGVSPSPPIACVPALWVRPPISLGERQSAGGDAVPLVGTVNPTDWERCDAGSDHFTTCEEPGANDPVEYPGQSSGRACPWSLVIGATGVTRHWVLHTPLMQQNNFQSSRNLRVTPLVYTRRRIIDAGSK